MLYDGFARNIFILRHIVNSTSLCISRWSIFGFFLILIFKNLNTLLTYHVMSAGITSFHICKSGRTRHARDNLSGPSGYNSGEDL